LRVSATYIASELRVMAMPCGSNIVACVAGRDRRFAPLGRYRENFGPATGAEAQYPLPLVLDDIAPDLPRPRRTRHWPG